MVTTSTGVPVLGVVRPLPQDVSIIPGFSSVPPKLIQKILAKDISELLLKSWLIEAEGSCCHFKHPKCTLLMDIKVWTKCYTTMVVILAAAYPAKAPHMYLPTISRASRTFKGSGLCTLAPSTRNMPSAGAYPDIITKYIVTELAAGRMLGPFPQGHIPSVHIKGMGVVPKEANNGPLPS